MDSQFLNAQIYMLARKEQATLQECLGIARLVPTVIMQRMNYIHLEKQLSNEYHLQNKIKY